MKVLFLDFDGPLCNFRTSIAYNCDNDSSFPKRLDPVGIGLLNRIAKQGVIFVVCSTWRILPDFNKPIETLILHGFHGKFHEDWATPKDPTGFRGIEVQKWMDKNLTDNDLFCCVDDDSDYFDYQNLVKTNNEGISFDNYLKICEYLQIPV